MQALTRNPLADPGILGINAGASLTVVITVFLVGVSNPNSYVWAAFPGALIGAVLVYALGSVGRDGATPMKLVLAGAVVSAFVASITSSIIFLKGGAQQQILFWEVGSVAGHTMHVVRLVAPTMIVGLLMAMGCARALNVLLIADILGRVVLSPAEVPTGIMVALIGAPVFILLARRKRLAEA
jgi:iron complex transport system permease protein